MILVTGIARSGTSILAELLSTDRRYRYIFEPREWDAPHMRPKSDRMTAADIPMFGSRWLDWYNAHQDTPLLVKSPRAVVKLPFLHALFRDLKIIHIVRDGRDVVCSWQPGLKYNRHGHLSLPIPPTQSNILYAAQMWTTGLQIALDDLEHIPHLQIRYEDLLTNPHSTLLSITKYTHIKPNPDFIPNISNNTTHPYHARYQSKWFTRDHDTRIGRYRVNLTPDELAQVEDIECPILTRLNYL
jgi:hypothetical protein